MFILENNLWLPSIFLNASLENFNLQLSFKN